MMGITHGIFLMLLLGGAGVFLVGGFLLGLARRRPAEQIPAHAALQPDAATMPQRAADDGALARQLAQLTGQLAEAQAGRQQISTECAQLRQRSATLQQEVTRLGSTAQQAEQQLEHERAERQKIAAAVSQTEQRAQQLARELTDARGKLSDREADSGKAAGALERRISGLDAQVKRLEEQRAADRRERAVLADKLDKAKREAAQQQRQLADSTKLGARAADSALEAKLARANAQVEQRDDRLSDITAKLARAEATLRQQQQQATAQAEAAEKKLNGALEQLVGVQRQQEESSEQQAATQRRLAALQQQLAAAQQQLGQTKEQLGASQQQLAASKEQIATSQQQRAASQQQRAASESELAEARKQLEESRNRLAELQQQLSQAREQLVAAERAAVAGPVDPRPEAQQADLAERVADLERRLCEQLVVTAELVPAEEQRLRQTIAEQTSELLQLRAVAGRAADLERQLGFVVDEQRTRRRLSHPDHAEAELASSAEEVLARLGAHDRLHAAVVTDGRALPVAALSRPAERQPLVAATASLLEVAETISKLVPLGAVRRILVSDERDSALCAYFSGGEPSEGLVLSSVVRGFSQGDTSELEQAVASLSTLTANRN